MSAWDSHTIANEVRVKKLMLVLTKEVALGAQLADALRCVALNDYLNPSSAAIVRQALKSYDNHRSLGRKL